MEIAMRIYEVAFWAVFALLAWGGSLFVIGTVLDEMMENEAIAGALSVILSIPCAAAATWFVIQMQYSDIDHYHDGRPGYGVGPYEIH